MDMITILHNPRCQKSRQGLSIIEQSKKPFSIRLYLEDQLSKTEIALLIKQLNCLPEELIRKGEPEWKDNFKNKSLTSQELIDAMVKYPKLIERPIVIKNSKAIIGRPPESIIDFIEK